MQTGSTHPTLNLWAPTQTVLPRQPLLWGHLGFLVSCKTQNGISQHVSVATEMEIEGVLTSGRDSKVPVPPPTGRKVGSLASLLDILETTLPSLLSWPRFAQTASLRRVSKTLKPYSWLGSNNPRNQQKCLSAIPFLFIKSASA